MSVKAIYTSRVAQFLLRLNLVSEKALTDMGESGVRYVKAEAPVRTGYLRDSTDYKVEGKQVFITNEANYAKYVEYGTFVMSANPFIRRGIAKAYNDLVSIIIRNLRV